MLNLDAKLNPDLFDEKKLKMVARFFKTIFGTSPIFYKDIIDPTANPNAPKIVLSRAVNCKTN